VDPKRLGDFATGFLAAKVDAPCANRCAACRLPRQHLDPAGGVLHTRCSTNTACLFFEQVIREKLRSRPRKEVPLIFNRRIPRGGRTHWRWALCRAPRRHLCPADQFAEEDLLGEMCSHGKCFAEFSAFRRKNRVSAQGQGIAMRKKTRWEASGAMLK
jgi:hypothetical protein